MALPGPKLDMSRIVPLILLHAKEEHQHDWRIVEEPEIQSALLDPKFADVYVVSAAFPPKIASP